MTISLKAPSALQVIDAKSGTEYTSDANKIITGVATSDVVDLIKAGCEFLPGVDGRANTIAAVDPGATDDSAANYAVGSLWVNATGGGVFVCEDATATAAVWVRTGGKNTPVNSTAASLTLTAALHAGRIVTINKADGTAITLPAATGTGNLYTVEVGTTITSVGSTIKAASAADSFRGSAWVGSDDTAAGKWFGAAAGTDDTVTLNGTTLGGYAGHIVTIRDVASGVFHVESFGKATGSEATPFSATVS